MNPQKKKKKQELKRQKPKQNELRRYLIYCEDKYAGPSYFEAITNRLRSGRRIKVLGDFGEPLNLVTKAKKHKDGAHLRREDDFEPYDEVWCVMDVEAPTPHPSISEALQVAGAAGICVAAVNPCFEAWALMHLSNSTRYMNNLEAQQTLASHVEVDYSVQDKKIGNIGYLLERIDRACAHSSLLREKHGHTDPIKHNPATNIDILVGILHSSVVVDPYSDEGKPRCLPTSFGPVK